MELKKTPLYQKHIENNAKIVDFFGWAMPIEYKSMLQEAKAVRNSCGLFDVTHMGEILIKGNEAFEFLQKLTSNDISLIKQGQMQYNLFLNDEAGIIDDFMVYREEDDFVCVVNASNKEKVLTRLKESEEGKVEVVDRSDKTAMLSLQGPRSSGLAGEVFGQSIVDLGYMQFVEKNIEGKDVFISRSGYTGEDGFEIYLPVGDACFWWGRIVEAGSKFDLKLCGLGARDILRIESGYTLYGHEIDETINPYEAALRWAVKTTKDFVGKVALLRLKREGINRKRVGFIMQERGIARQGYLIYSDQGAIGKVSSGTYSPNLEKFIGMAYVESKFAQPETIVEVEIRDKLYKAKIAKLPFISPKTRR